MVDWATGQWRDRAIERFGEVARDALLPASELRMPHCAFGLRPWPSALSRFRMANSDVPLLPPFSTCIFPSVPAPGDAV